jgi:hypothetical protein
VTSSAQTPEPTDEQRAVAWRALFPNHPFDNWQHANVHQQADVESVARALAAAVQQERDRLRALIDDMIVDNGLTCHPFPSNNPCQCSTARALREVSR